MPSSSPASKAPGSTPTSASASRLVYPEGGRVIIFESDRIPHEVQATFAPRHALTMWYYDDDARAEAVERAATAGRRDLYTGAKRKRRVREGEGEGGDGNGDGDGEDGYGGEFEVVDPTWQREGQAFISELVTRGQEPGLLERVRGLSEGALRVVAQVLGWADKVTRGAAEVRVMPEDLAGDRGQLVHVQKALGAMGL